MQTSDYNYAKERARATYDAGYKDAGIRELERLLDAVKAEKERALATANRWLEDTTVSNLQHADVFCVDDIEQAYNERIWAIETEIEKERGL